MKKATPETTEGQLTVKGNTSASSQRKTILHHLHNKGKLRTLHAREALGIMTPAARILELRKDGHKIETHWTNTQDISGTKHRENKYVLMPAGNTGTSRV